MTAIAQTDAEFVPRKRGFRPGHLLGRSFTYGVLIFGAFLFLMPFAWMVSTSLKPKNLVSVVPIVWIPPELIWENYITPFQFMPFGIWYRNTMIITAVNLVGILFST